MKMATPTPEILNERIKEAEALSTLKIQSCIPPLLFDEITKNADSLSAPWLGLLIGLISPVQYRMKFAHVDLENSSWKEPTIVWPLQHMSSGARKSNIFNFIKQFDDKLREDDDKDDDFMVSEITFERLGVKMQDNNNTAYWIFDEARLFFAQLGLYQNGSSSSLDEAVLLTLYDGGKWVHSTNKGANFNLKATKLVLGGLTQTAHIIKLLADVERMESGFLPRFLIFLLKPYYVDIMDLRPNHFHAS